MGLVHLPTKFTIEQKSSKCSAAMNSASPKSWVSWDVSEISQSWKAYQKRRLKPMVGNPDELVLKLKLGLGSKWNVPRHQEFVCFQKRILPVVVLKPPTFLLCHKMSEWMLTGFTSNWEMVGDVWYHWVECLYLPWTTFSSCDVSTCIYIYISVYDVNALSIVYIYMYMYIYIYIPAPSKGCQLNPNGCGIDTLSQPFKAPKLEGPGISVNISESIVPQKIYIKPQSGSR